MATGLRVRKQDLDPNDIQEGVNQFDICLSCIAKDFDIKGYGGAWENQINLYKNDWDGYFCDLCGVKLTTVSKRWGWLVDQDYEEVIS